MLQMPLCLIDQLLCCVTADMGTVRGGKSGANSPSFAQFCDINHLLELLSGVSFLTKYPAIEEDPMTELTPQLVEDLMNNVPPQQLSLIHI